MATLTQDQIITNLRTDPVFALGFAVDNNFAGIQKALAVQGIKVDTDIQARNALINLVSGDKQKVQNILDATPYINVDTTTPGIGYTGGMLEYFKATTAPDKLQAAKAIASNQGGRLDINALLTGLGAGILGFAGYQPPASGGPTNTAPLTAEQIAAQKAAAEKAAAAKKRKTTIIVVSCVVGGIIIITVLYFVFRKPKKAKPPTT